MPPLLYTPPPNQNKSALFLQGRFEGTAWDPTPGSSRRGTGDDRLHERTGEFWYRREFVVPDHWREAELALLLGAVDDFDVTWINGRRIGRTEVETPHHWETPRFYRLPARMVRPGQTNTLLIKVTNPAFDGGDGPAVLGLASALSVPEADAPPLTRRALSREPGTPPATGESRCLKISARFL